MSLHGSTVSYSRDESGFYIATTSDGTNFYYSSAEDCVEDSVRALEVLTYEPGESKKLQGDIWRPRPSVDMTPDPEPVADDIWTGNSWVTHNGFVDSRVRYCGCMVEEFNIKKHKWDYENGLWVDKVPWFSRYMSCFQVLHIGKDVSWPDAIFIGVGLLILTMIPSAMQSGWLFIIPILTALYVVLFFCLVQTSPSGYASRWYEKTYENSKYRADEL